MSFQQLECCDFLTTESLMALINSQVLAIKVPNFVESQLCDRLANWYKTHRKQETYTTEYYINGIPVQKRCGCD
ncbi:hypothetical protein [Okeania sp. KiyG1]|uniref:hypothetical protein n=1 Tax=Okeania sp. KiyG1 TaxID=2720165 RepID=UPI0019219285|nr:hypothetical protein [Okeania sp. KiyG1]GGA54827.1 hypothetical protein CYANOKiyG1_75290 [Okeania sp. KiyG1]